MPAPRQPSRRKFGGVERRGRQNGVRLPGL